MNTDNPNTMAGKPPSKPIAPELEIMRDDWTRSMKESEFAVWSASAKARRERIFRLILFVVGQLALWGSIITVILFRGADHPGIGVQ